MKVSIIVTTYNSEKYLPRTLHSLINQIYKNIEIIVIDTGSTDDTKKIIKKYVEKDNRILPFYQLENKGVSVARNIGLKASTGDYIMFVDSDDEITKDAIRRLVDISKKYDSDYVDSYELFKYTNKKGKEFSFIEGKMPKKILSLKTINDSEKVIDMYTYIKGKLIKKELFEGLSFDENLKLYENLVLEHQIKTRIKNYVFINKIVYIYYQREDFLVNKLGKNHLCYLDSARTVKDIYKEFNIKIRNVVNAILFQNAVLILFTKIIKNEDSNEENVKLAKEFLNELVEIFPDYMKNKKLNFYIKKKINKLISNEKLLIKYVKKYRRKDFISLYFKYLSIFRKYEIKNPLS